MVKKFLVLLLILLPLTASAQFSRDLYFGMRNNVDVVRLQEFLRGQGFFTYPGSTGNYFTVTLDAVRKFQKAHGISPIGGYFGPQSRAAANRLLARAPVSVVSGSSTANSPAAPSSYKGKIAIGSVSGTSEIPEFESIIIENRDQAEKISITGFVVENSRGERFVIPKGYDLPGFSASAQDPVFLKPGERAIITAGRQEKYMDFRSNLCTGYLDEISKFSTSLSHQCPRPDTRRLTNLSDRCLRIIDATASCRRPSFEGFVDSDCSVYLSDNLNYAGCVRNYRSRADFYSREWLVWMQRSSEFFRNVREKVILRDPQGRVADEYSY